MVILTGDEEDSPKTMRYRRLTTDFASTDPFTGLYLAAFGSSGPEVLQLRREPDPVDVSTHAVALVCMLRPQILLFLHYPRCWLVVQN